MSDKEESDGDPKSEDLDSGSDLKESDVDEEVDNIIKKKSRKERKKLKKSGKHDTDDKKGSDKDTDSDKDNTDTNEESDNDNEENIDDGKESDTDKEKSDDETDKESDKSDDDDVDDDKEPENDDCPPKSSKRKIDENNVDDIAISALEAAPEDPQEQDFEFPTSLKNIKFVSPEERITRNTLTIYEIVRILGTRITQLKHGAKPMLKKTKKASEVEIAIQELLTKVIPIILIRPLPNNIFEKWKISEMEKIDYV